MLWKQRRKKQQNSRIKITLYDNKHETLLLLKTEKQKLVKGVWLTHRVSHYTDKKNLITRLYSDTYNRKYQDECVSFRLEIKIVWNINKFVFTSLTTLTTQTVGCVKVYHYSKGGTSSRYLTINRRYWIIRDRWFSLSSLKVKIRLMFGDYNGCENKVNINWRVLIMSVLSFRITRIHYFFSLIQTFWTYTQYDWLTWRNLRDS